MGEVKAGVGAAVGALVVLVARTESVARRRRGARVAGTKGGGRNVVGRKPEPAFLEHKDQLRGVFHAAVAAAVAAATNHHLSRHRDGGVSSAAASTARGRASAAGNRLGWRDRRGTVA